MKRAQSSEQMLSLVKSRDMLDRITTKIAAFDAPHPNTSTLIQNIQASSKKAQQTLDSRIDDNFHLLMHSPTLMPLPNNDPTKENLQTTPTATALDGAKALMHNYWDKNKKHDRSHQDRSRNDRKHDLSRQDHKHVHSAKDAAERKGEKLPQIQWSGRGLAAYIRGKERERERQAGGAREEEREEEVHIAVAIRDFKCENDGREFLRFQKRYYKRWAEIDSILRALEKFAEHYQLSAITVQTTKVFELIELAQRGERLTPHHLLRCCDHAEEISEQNSRKAGIRFFGERGLERAVVVIQAVARGYAQRKLFRAALLRWRSARRIQAQFRAHLLHRDLRQRIYQRHLDKLAAFSRLQQAFQEDYRTKETTARKRVEVHIPSHNLSDSQKISAANYLEWQNAELCRIFRIAQRSASCETHVVYVSPVALPRELLSYYRKLLELGAEECLDHRLTILTPDYPRACPPNMPLTQQLYYSPRSLNKIRTLVRGAHAYIVPSTPSNDYLHLATELNLPLYSAHPQKLLYLQTKAGCKSLQEQAKAQSGEGHHEGLGVLPYSVDIYTESSLLNELTNLIYRYPYVRRWVLKIDNESCSRGVAWLDVSKLVGRRLLRKVSEEEVKPSQQKQLREEIYSLLETALVVNREERIVPIDRQAYPSQAQFLSYFYTRGGIIEAAINNFDTDLDNSCLTVNLEPDGQAHFLCSYRKVTSKNKAVAAYFDSGCLAPPGEVDRLVECLRRMKLFGYFTFEFLSIGEQAEKTMHKLEGRLWYLNSVDCHLSALSAAHFLRAFIAPSSNALFVPLLKHPALAELRLQTFFHLCRLQNISFDIQKKVGNVFLFLNGLESGCLGVMAFNDRSREDCYTHTAEVLDFLNSKLKQGAKDVPEAFFALKNAVNGHLNRLKKHRSSQKTLPSAKALQQ